MHGCVSDGRDFGWPGRQMRNRPDQVRIVRDMCIHLPGFGNRPGTVMVGVPTRMQIAPIGAMFIFVRYYFACIQILFHFLDLNDLNPMEHNHAPCF